MNWEELAEMIVKRIVASGAEYGDVRILESTGEVLRGEDRRIDAIRETYDTGFGVRVLYKGAWGFAASSIMSMEEGPRIADLAIDIAKGSSSLAREPIRLAEEPVHRDSIATPTPTRSLLCSP